jgi:hypothetical protein
LDATLTRILYLTLTCIVFAVTATPARPATATYSLDRASFATSTDWFLIDNYPTPKRIDPRESLYFRRLYFIYVDESLRDDQFANTVSFVCQKRRKNHLLIHLPDHADIKTIRPRKQWISRMDLRVLTDDFGTRFDAEYIDGDFFVDFTDDTTERLVEVLKSRVVTIEFGPEDERILLYAGDTGPDNSAHLKSVLRDMVPILARSFGGKSRVFRMSEMFRACDAIGFSRVMCGVSRPARRCSGILG